MNFQSFGFLAFLAAATAVCLGLARWDRRIAAKCLTMSVLSPILPRSSKRTPTAPERSLL